MTDTPTPETPVPCSEAGCTIQGRHLHVPARTLIVRPATPDLISADPDYRDGQIAELEQKVATAEAALARLRELSNEWRQLAEQHKKHGDCYRVGEGWGLDRAANDLDAALASAEASPAPMWLDVGFLGAEARPAQEPQEFFDPCS